MSRGRNKNELVRYYAADEKAEQFVWSRNIRYVFASARLTKLGNLRVVYKRTYES